MRYHVKANVGSIDLDEPIIIGKSGKIYTRASLLLYKKYYLFELAINWGVDETELKSGFKTKNDVINLIKSAKRMQGRLSL